VQQKMIITILLLRCSVERKIALSLPKDAIAVRQKIHLRASFAVPVSTNE